MQKIYILSLLVLAGLISQAQINSVAPEIGVVQDLENDSLLLASGFQYLVESTPKILSPRNVSNQEFQARLQTIKNLQVPLYACNLFIPGDLKVVGPDVDEKAVLDFVEIVLRRAQAAGLSLITWGSGGSRGIPEGFGRVKAKEQFIDIARKVAEVAARYDIVLALENLNSTECNFINTIQEALAIVKSVDHKNFRLCIDIYHMLKEGESPDAIVGTKGYAVYCELAEKEGRTPPGVHGDDFTPYFTALYKVGYKGKIVIECRWKDLAAQGKTACQTIRGQIDAIYKF
jgi:sugar phosphate isomerase/epimerase